MQRSARVDCQFEVRPGRGALILRVSGRLSEVQVPALLEVCEDADPLMILELDQLMSADAVGLDALLHIEQRGVLLVGLPEYLRVKLRFLARERHS